MGLGKTIQVLSLFQLLSSLSLSSSCPHRFLVVVPTSLVYNWETEIQTWCSNLSYLLFVYEEWIMYRYIGNQEEKEKLRKQYLQSSHSFSILVTTYYSLLHFNI